MNNDFLIITIILLLIYNIIFNKKENFINYQRCKEKPVKGIMKLVFDEHNISKDDENFDLYIPCGYNKVEKELKNLNLEKNKIIYGISGCDKIVSKNNLWKILENEYGRKEASKMMPETFLISENKDMKAFKKNFIHGDQYILKKNLQRKRGIKFANDLQTINKLKNDNFKLIQKFMDDVFVINKRKMNLRIYILVRCQNNNIDIYKHNLGKCLYTSKDVTGNTMDFDENITNSYKVEEEIRNNNPLTLKQLKDYFVKKKLNYTKLTDNLDNLLSKLARVIHKPLCKLENIKENLKFQLFGLDIIFNDKLETYLLEINKGPDMIAKDDDDKRLKKKIQIDTFQKIGLIDIQDENYKNGYIKI